MKKIKFLLIAAVAIATAFSSCKKEEEISKPQIQSLELGYQNSKTASPGGDLHIEAGIIAEGLISSIVVSIHPEQGQTWSFEKTYAGSYAGVKNTDFHEHISIPSTAELGEYHFHLKVTDSEGNTVEAESELTLVPNSGNAPVITVTSAPASGQYFVPGDTIRISGNISHPEAIAGAYIALVNSNDALADTAVTSANTISVLHSHSFTNPKSFDFDAFIVVGAPFDNDHPSPKPINWQQKYLIHLHL
jgi:hypothetical protein